jgi:dolichyl-phosphate-mannose-protein mannosyltransferase
MTEITMNDTKIFSSRKEYLYLGLLIVFYTIIALYNLGTTKTPQTYWQNSIKGEGFVADFGGVKKLDRIYYFGGLGEGSYKLEFSEDGTSWKSGLSIQKKNIFVWEFVKTKAAARYVRILADSTGVMLNELGFIAENSQKPVGIKSISSSTISSASKGKPENLFDEQDTVAYRPSFYNGMYFDEIYFARTAYEYLHLIKPYETSHPPLAKLLIGFGVWLFGMNPFGWRIVGTVFGILMIPIMYLFGKAVFKKAEYAFMCAFLMAFDFMHFVQSRISTIEVFGVFFIILMYYFMYKYYMMSFYEDEFRKTLVPLGLSGLFFGMGLACKWNSIFAGIGLALILLESIIRLFPRYFTRTLVWSMIFFIVVPVIFYCLTYIPLIMAPGEKGFETIEVYQKHMLNYHSNLKAEHPFSSPWWEWPIMKKPMWFYGGQDYLPAGKISSIVSFGNPAIWWFGSLGVLAALVISVTNKDKKMFVILVGMAATYLPWIVVSRLAFIYYFFACMPFLIICLVYVISWIIERYSKSRYLVYGYMAVVLTLFAMFYPVLSGAVVNKDYVEKFLRWFKTWYFFT